MRSLPSISISLLCAAVLLTAVRPARAADDEADFFEKRVRPVLIEHCYSCHSQQPGAKVKGDLRLDTKALLAKGGENGPVVVAGDPDKSRLIAAVRWQTEDLRMPPKQRLTDAQVADLTAWVRRGAVDPRTDVATTPAAGDVVAARKRWPFATPQAAAVPGVKDAGWVKTDVDRFVLAKLEARGLAPANPADKRTLVRRATFDLTGLPPTDAEVEAFVTDPSPDAFAKVIDRLLASPAYGERWGRHWLDVVRYTDLFDTRSLNGDDKADVPFAWRYRDWVVDAFNRDLPYDQFVARQIAGDLLPPPDGSADGPTAGGPHPGVVPTGVYAIGEWGGGDADKEKMLTDIVDDQVDVTGKAFLGLTIACARCHDHKFDPISQADYYGLAGVFFSSHILPGPGAKTNGSPVLRIPIGKPPPAVATAPATAPAAGKPKPPADLTPVAHGLQEGGTPGSAYAGFKDAPLMIRGRYDRPAAAVPRRLPRVLAGDAQPPIVSGSGRLELARWVASADNPLTARVMANRIWQHHFGDGIVRTPNNFGALGSPPTHPELLDYLAERFVASGWSVKAMHRLVMLSATYQQVSAAGPAMAADPENLLWGRQARRRLDAESLRDALLAVAGTLDRAAGGPPVADLASPRRTVYLRTIRSDRATYRMLFDAADPQLAVDKRAESTVAPQALFLLNSPFAKSQAAALAAAARRHGGDDRATVAWLYRRLYARPPTPRETDVAAAALGRWHERGAAAAAGPAWEAYAHVLLCANEFVYVD